MAVAGTVVGCGLRDPVRAVCWCVFWTAVWPGGALRSFLQPHCRHCQPGDWLRGFLAVSVVTIALCVLLFGGVPPSVLLAGQTAVERPDARQTSGALEFVVDSSFPR